MSLFLKKVALFVLIPLMGIAIGIALPVYPSEKGSVLFAKIEKDSLLQNTPSPRIIFLGGSSLALGLNSQLIKDSLGLNPINTGLDCNIGITNITNDILPFIKPNDIVVIASEYEAFFGRLLYGGYPMPLIKFKISPGHLNSLSLDQWLNMFRLIPAFALPRLQLWKYFSNNINPSYNRYSFNQYGDDDKHWKLKSMNPIPTKGCDGSFNEQTMAILRDFEQKLAAKEASFYISFPPYQSASFSNNEKEVKEVETAIIHAGFSLLGTPERYRMPDSLMFDSPYHLVKEGVDRRTELLISDIKTAILSKRIKERNG